jgi:CheY-like chemotaxis protein
MTRPAVLVVEDDEALRRFVAMTLENVDIDLVMCGSVAEALRVLAQRPFKLVVTDLMLPDDSGEALLQRLSNDPALGRAPRVAVFSAGLDAPTIRRLRTLGAWRTLAKPASPRELEACVRAALDLPARDMPRAPPASAQDGAVQRHFAGNVALYSEFAASCAPQFALDVQAGDDACQRGDAAALLRLTHSLKTVLGLLGHDRLGSMAGDIELAAAVGDLASARANWPALREGLAALASGGGAQPS